MTSCGDNYFSINGKRVCGIYRWYDQDGNGNGPWDLEYDHVQLGAAGEAVELYLYNLQPVDGKIHIEFYTSTEAKSSS